MRIKNTIILTFISAGLIFLFFLLPANKRWLNGFIFRYWNEYRVQKNDLDLAARMKAGYGGVYTVSKTISSFFERKGIRDTALALLPPTAYFKSQGMKITI